MRAWPPTSPAQPTGAPAGRFLFFALGTIAAVPVLAVTALLPVTPITAAGSLYLVGCILIVVGMVSSPWWRRRGLGLALLGASVLGVTITVRIACPPSGSRLVLVTFPRRSGPRGCDRIFDERDVVLFGVRAAPYLGLVLAAEKDGLFPALAAAYARMPAPLPPSPFLLSWLNRQQPDGFDALISEPATGTPPRRGIVFLHGYGGSFTLECWLVAEPGERIGAVTICPSTGRTGAWWSPDGEAIVRQSVAYLRERGVERIYLAGLSNGGIGASRLAQRLEADLAGLILISGADPAAALSGLPAVVVHGTDDDRIPRSVAERTVAALGPSSKYVLVAGDHLVLLKQAERVQGAIAEWLVEQEARARPSAGAP